MLNMNPVIVAKHFQYRVETFFTEILLSDADSIGKIVYYALRTEFFKREVHLIYMHIYGRQIVQNWIVITTVHILIT